MQKSFVALLLLLASSLLPTRLLAAAETTAVVLIDMQYGFYDRGGVRGSEGLETLVSNQIELLERAVEKNVPVVVLQYRGFGDTDTRLMASLADHETAVIWKSQDDGFTERALREQLDAWGVDTLIVAGVNGCCCVYSTVASGLSLGYRVVTSPEVVGNINFNPPRFPNDTWYPRHTAFQAYDSLDELLGTELSDAERLTPLARAE